MKRICTLYSRNKSTAGILSGHSTVQVSKEGHRPQSVTFLLNQLFDSAKTGNAIRIKGLLQRINADSEVRQFVPPHELQQILHHATIITYISSNEIESAFKVYTMAKQGSDAFITLLSECIRLKRHDLCQKILKDQSSFERNSKYYNVLIRYHLSTRKMEMAKKVLTQMDKDGVEIRIDDYNTLIHGLAKDGNLNHAIFLFQRMLQRKITYACF